MSPFRNLGWAKLPGPFVLITPRVRLMTTLTSSPAPVNDCFTIFQWTAENSEEFEVVEVEVEQVLQSCGTGEVRHLPTVANPIDFFGFGLTLYTLINSAFSAPELSTT